MYFVTCTKYIASETISIHQFLGCYSVNCHHKIDSNVTDQEINTVDNVESMESRSIKNLTKESENRAKEYC